MEDRNLIVLSMTVFAGMAFFVAGVLILFQMVTYDTLNILVTIMVAASICYAGFLNYLKFEGILEV